MMLLDTHCHLELFKTLPRVIPKDLAVITMTNTPKTVDKNEELFIDSENIFIAAGLHPQLVATRKNELEDLIKLIESHRFIGEIGIDGEALAIEEQIYAFSEIITHIDNIGSRIVSIHSRKADKLVIDLLADLVSRKSNKYILHWFTGSKTSLDKAIKLGCYFSINPKMCISKRGVEIIKKIPSNRLLIETDAPFLGGITNLNEVKTIIFQTIKKIEKIRGEELIQIVSENSKRIINS